MNTTTTPNNTSGSIPRGIWIGGGLMALTIVALATTLVVRNNDAAPDSSATPVMSATAASATESTAPAATPVVVAKTTPANESSRPVHHTAPKHDADAQTGNAEPQRVASVPVCSTCGVVDGFTAVEVQGKNNGVGAVAGGLGGALVGSKIAGRSNHTLGGVIGAVGGGLLGNAIESHERKSTAYDVRVRMNDGSIRTVRQATIPTVGAHVNVDGNTLKAVDAQG